MSLFLILPLGTQPVFAFEIFGITLFGDKKEPGEVPDKVSYTVDLRVNPAQDDLEDALKNSSRLIGDEELGASGDLGIVVKARDDRKRLLAVLYEKALYGAVVTITIQGRDIDALPPNPSFDRTRPIPVVVTVETGPVFTFDEIQFGGDAAGRNPADYDLVPGTPAGSLIIIRAGDKIVEELKSQSRPFAKIATRTVIADHKTSTVDVVLAVDGGPVAPIGDVTVTGAKDVRPGFIERYSRLDKGDAYSPEALRKANERLRALGTFSSVTIHEADSLSRDGMLPLTIEVSEGKQHYFGFGAQYSTGEGFGVQSYWGHRNLFGEAESLRIEGAVSRLAEKNDIMDFDYSAGIVFTKPGAFVPEATLKAALVGKSENPDAYSAQLVTASLGLTYELSDMDILSASGELAWERSEDAFGDNRYLTFAVPFKYDRDARDNKLNPTEGYLGSISLKPAYDFYGETPYFAIEGLISGYQSFGAEDNLVFAEKLTAGTLLGGGTLRDIPTTQRFFIGGGGSVRGYAYKEISPYTDAGQATGGRSYVTASLEARVRITDKIGLVPFVDAGSVGADSVPDFSDIRAGAGLGLRYATPFGPLRLDFAIPLNKYENGSDYGIYAGIGQSF